MFHVRTGSKVDLVPRSTDAIWFIALGTGTKATRKRIKHVWPVRLQNLWPEKQKGRELVSIGMIEVTVAC